MRRSFQQSASLGQTKLRIQEIAISNASDGLHPSLRPSPPSFLPHAPTIRSGWYYNPYILPYIHPYSTRHTRDTSQDWPWCLGGCANTKYLFCKKRGRDPCAPPNSRQLNSCASTRHLWESRACLPTLKKMTCRGAANESNRHELSQADGKQPRSGPSTNCHHPQGTCPPTHHRS